MHEEFTKYLVEEIENRFWSKVEKGADCWLWKGHRLPGGYGTFKGPGGKMFKAHRFAYEMAHGFIPDGLMCLHSCDTRNCVNPAHLRTGTNRDNMNDMHSRGRANRPVGSKHPAARLTEVDVSEIRRRLNTGETQVEVASAYGLHRQTIYQIAHRKIWRHVA